MAIKVSNTGVLYSETGLLDEIGEYMSFYDEANTTLYFDATGRFPYSTATTGTWLNLAPSTKSIVANTTALGATVANTYGPNAMIFTNIAGTAGRIDRTASSNTIIGPAITSGTGKMTAAVWAYSTNWYQTTGQRFVSSTQSGGWSIALNDSGFTGTTSVGIVFYNITAGGYCYMEANTRNAFTSSTGWNHLAWTFDGKYGFFYINGQVANTYTAAAATNYIDVGGCLAIGAEASSSTATTSPYLSGALASIFVSNRSFSNDEIYNLFLDTDPNVNLSGSRTYVVNSTYSTTTTIAPNTPVKYYSNGALRTTGTVGFDEVSMNSGSLFFNTSGQYLSMNAAVTAGAFNLGTNNFTIEFYANRTSAAAQQMVIGNRSSVSATANGSWWIDNGTNSKIRFGFTSPTTGTVYTFSSTTDDWPPANTWFHFAAVRTGARIDAYLNGKNIANTTAISAGTGFGSNAGVYINGFPDSSAWSFPGYLTNIRVSNTAIYTSEFIPPKSILEANNNTVFLLQCANSSTYITDSSSNKLTVTNNGSVTYNTNSFFNYSVSGTAVQKIYSDGILAVDGYLDELPSTTTASALLVGGGGGGSGNLGNGLSGAGGGGGGVVPLTDISLTRNISYQVIVGLGGAAGSKASPAPGSGGNTTFASYTAYGGGGGKDASGVQSGNGGSGGGAVDNGTTQGGAGKGVYPGSTYISATRQGYDGSIGAGQRGVTPVRGGGGGGAGGAATPGYISGSTYVEGIGGAGLVSSITGSAVTYAGGGNGGSSSGTGASGAGPGGGGGGARGDAFGDLGGAGNTGICIITYPGPQAATGGTITTNGSNTVHTFTSNGTFILL